MLDNWVRWLYEPGALTPSVRYEKGKLHYVMSGHQGTAREMLNENGTLVWAQRLKTWEKVGKSQVIASNDPDYHVGCNLRFAGQYEDTESGLYYNRFCYYSPETAQYISPDPFGLRGGVYPYSYVKNPTGWINPFGLSATSNGYEFDMVNNPGPLGVHPSNIRWAPAGNFSGGKYNSKVLDEDLILFRGGNGGGGRMVWANGLPHHHQLLLLM
ncbi:RHS repeat-associated core domain-containing protein [Xenorhabdus santafensis]|uniref:RHS repeat-associated core domain-containing protein n=1 Tax=Xenorhabdus santafensis TaxID=2582833 RepID=UPI0029E7FDE4|nr:RHS repeat-associated core domain-containing protein [Xenorhabdus sp. 12]